MKQVNAMSSTVPKPTVRRDCPRVDEHRTGIHGGLVHDAQADAETVQPDGQHKPGRPAPTIGTSLSELPMICAILSVVPISRCSRSLLPMPCPTRVLRTRRR